LDVILWAVWFVAYALNPRGSRRVRGRMYRVARVAGNAGPWALLDVRRIVRRWVNRCVGQVGGRFAFGPGGLSRVLRRIIGA
jgi:hypothetical protein